MQSRHGLIPTSPPLESRTINDINEVKQFLTTLIRIKMKLLPCETCGKQLAKNMPDNEICPDCKNSDPHGNKRHARYFKFGMILVGLAVVYYLYMNFRS